MSHFDASYSFLTVNCSLNMITACIKKMKKNDRNKSSQYCDPLNIYV